jgi:hypothetical protein
MRTSKMKILSCLLIFVLGISIVSAQSNVFQTTALAQSAEAQAVGGIRCGAVWGLAIGLAFATMSPCSVLCATAGWFTMLALENCT